MNTDDALKRASEKGTGPRRGLSQRRTARVPDDGLRPVQVPAGEEAGRVPQASGDGQHQGDQDAAQHRAARPGLQDAPHPAVPGGRRPGQGHDSGSGDARSSTPTWGTTCWSTSPRRRATWRWSRPSRGWRAARCTCCCRRSRNSRRGASAPPAGIEKQSDPLGRPARPAGWRSTIFFSQGEISCRRSRRSVARPSACG